MTNQLLVVVDSIVPDPGLKDQPPLAGSVFDQQAQED
jgi:hypothetical protein